jgi:predicted MFS family arabinose efflux permease
VFMLQVASRGAGPGGPSTTQNLPGAAGTQPTSVTLAATPDNPHKTAHYALCTGFMALGMMLPGMWAGWLQERLGYTNFFIWCCVATLPSFLAVAWVYKGLNQPSSPMQDGKGKA